jgi:hypothetical protein
MPSTTITIPDFDFTGFYYPQVLEALIRYKRINVPELTDESEYEPAIQLLRAFALVGHLNNTLVDLVANESTLPTARLVESVRNMLRLIDYNMSPATPATTEVVYQLARTFTASTQIVPEGAQVATERQGSEAAIVFEADEALTIPRTDQLGACFSVEAGVYTDRTAAVNSSNALDDFDPWVTPAAGDAIYFGHSYVMWDVLGLTLAANGSGLTGVWEVYEGNWLKTAPDAVSLVGPDLRVELNGLLGTTSRAGTTVRVTLNSDGAYEEATVQWDGTDNFVLIGLLGQTTPSTTASDYSVGSDWTELEVTDGTSGLSANGSVEYDLPQTDELNWARTEVNSFTGYWLRYRIISVSSPVSPTLRLARIDTGGQYVLRAVTQGQLFADDPLGSSTGLPDQRFTCSREHFIAGTMVVTVDGEEWTEVQDFLSSLANDKHFRVELGENDKPTVVFGSGTNGKIPPAGVNNIVAEGRYGADQDGNVGPETLTVDKTGLTYINRIWNPRQASGWQEAEGASEASLERAKIAGPASLRVKDVALGPDDVVTLATTRYTTAAGAKPYSRALAIEEGLGPKTVKLVVVKKGGGLATNDELDDLGTWFNGDKYATPPLPKRVVANQEVTAFNYTQRVIDVDATVTARDLTAEQVVNQLTQILAPEALKADGITYEWDFGDKVNLSRLIHEIFQTDEDKVEDVEITTPASDVTLGSTELPVAGTITITIVEP